VAALAVDGQSVSVGTERRRLVAEVVTAAAVAWVSEERVLVAGRSGDRAALFRVTADGAFADDQSPGEAGGPLTDVVVFPQRAAGTGGGDIVAQTASDVFFVYGDNVEPRPELVAPFYAG
jgi:hypothetical protein